MCKDRQHGSSAARLLCIDQYGHLGGGQKSLLDLLPAFSERGWQPSVVAPDGPFEKLLRTGGFRTHNVNCGDYSVKKKSFSDAFEYATKMLQLVRTLSAIAAEENVTALYVNGPRLMPPAASVARRYGLPLVFHCHNRLLQNSVIALAGASLRLSKASVIACCDYAVEPLKRYVPPQRLRVIFNGVEEMAVREPKLPRKIRRIGVVGRVETDKGQLQFVEAARVVLQRMPDCTFSVVGEPMFSGREYYHKVVESSRRLPVEFLEWRDDIADVYADLDLLVVPSSPLEATTRVILEAYSAGVPVVAFPSGGIPEVLQDNETGFLARDTGTEALAQRILSVIAMDVSRVTAVVERSRKKWAECYTVGAYRKAVCDVIDRAAGALRLKVSPWRRKHAS